MKMNKSWSKEERAKIQVENVWNTDGKDTGRKKKARLAQVSIWVPVAIVRVDFTKAESIKFGQ